MRKLESKDLYLAPDGMRLRVRSLAWIVSETLHTGQPLVASLENLDIYQAEDAAPLIDDYMAFKRCAVGTILGYQVSQGGYAYAERFTGGIVIALHDEQGESIERDVTDADPAETVNFLATYPEGEPIWVYSVCTLDPNPAFHTDALSAYDPTVWDEALADIEEGA